LAGDGAGRRMSARVGPRLCNNSRRTSRRPARRRAVERSVAPARRRPTARRDRLVTAAGTVPGVVWLVLFAGAVLTISFTFFFGTQNVVVQTLMTGMLSRLIFAGLFVIVAIDRPFAGSVKVQPEALHAVLNEFGRMKHP
jgi:hypothetical protein